MDTRLQSLQITTFTDVLDARQPVEQEVSKLAPKENKVHPKENPSYEPAYRKRTAEGNAQKEADTKQRLLLHLQDKARYKYLCLGCLDPGHQIRDCPYNTLDSEPLLHNNL